MSARETIIRRVKKLLALAKSPNQHEAEAAAAKAQELLQQHKLKAAEIEEDSEVTIDSWSYATKAIFWKRDLAFVVARGFFCRCVHTPASKRSLNKAWLNFVGKREDIEVAKEVYGWLSSKLEWLAEAHVQNKIDYSHSTPIKNDFLAGAVLALDQRIAMGQKIFTAESEKSRAIVKVSDQKVEEHLAKVFQNLEPSPIGRDVRDFGAWRAGMKAGETVNLKPEKSLPNEEGS